MRKILVIFLFGLYSCNNNGYEVIDTKIIKGKVSAIEEGHRGRASRLPKLYVQDNKHTFEVDIPFANENDYKVGDSITLIIQQVKKFKLNKV
jgi:hypothetical protein